MLFRIIKIRNTVKDLRADPGKFAGEEASGLLTGLFVMPIIAAVLLLGGLFALGFTGFLGGPYGFFKVLFFLVLFPVGFFFFLLYKMAAAIKRITKASVDSVIKVDSKVVE